jgi:hypothetical protein
MYELLAAFWYIGLSLIHEGLAVSDSFSKKTTAYLDSPDHELKSIFTRIKQLQTLQALVSPYLDDQIRPFCQVANLIGKRLILVVANGSIATQIRFQAVDLLRKFRQDPILAHIQDIQCKVSPTLATAAHPPARKAVKMSPLSVETAEIVRGIADSLEDPALREIMRKIADKQGRK